MSTLLYSYFCTWVLFIYSVTVSVGKSWRRLDHWSTSHHQIFYHPLLRISRRQSLCFHGQRFRLIIPFDVVNCLTARDLRSWIHLQLWSEVNGDTHPGCWLCQILHRGALVLTHDPFVFLAHKQAQASMLYLQHPPVKHYFRWFTLLKLGGWLWFG